MTSPANATVTVRGTVELMFYSSPGFSAGRLRVEPDETVAFAGPAMLRTHDLVILHGAWEQHPKFGRQLKVERFELDRKPSADGLAHYLASHPTLKGIGPAKAKRLADTFGDDFDRAVEHEPDLVRTVGKLSAEAMATLRTEWLHARALNATLTWMAQFELTYHQMAKLVAAFGNSVISILESDPYLLIREIPGMGFKRVDLVARRVGIAKDHHSRLRAGLVHCVAERLDQGDCWVEEATLVELANKLLVMDQPNSRACIAAALDEALAEGVLACVSIGGRFLICQQTILDQEQDIAALLVARRGPNRHFAEVDVAPLIDHRLNEAQCGAVEAALAHNLVVISGPGGAGKTFVIGALAALYADRGLRVVLAAPTGKAAKRMEEVVGRPAVTLHRLLGYDGRKFTNGPDKPVDADLLVIDEVSMVDVPLAWHLLRAIDFARTAVVLVGDHNQLPPIGPGNLLRDLIDRRIVPAVLLDKVMRQAGVLKESSLAILRGVVRDSDPAPPGGRPAWFIANRFSDVVAAQAHIRDLYEYTLSSRWSFDAVRDVQLLTPTRKGPLGTEELNALLQRVIQKQRWGVDVPPLEPGRRPRLRMHDRVIQTRNNYDLGVMNGAIGFVTELGDEPGEVMVRFDDTDVYYAGDAAHELALAYALTIHKFQGSQIPCAVLVIHKSHSFMHHRNLLYTGVTRAQRTAIVIGDAWGMRACAAKQQVERRKTFLSVIDLPTEERIRE